MELTVVFYLGASTGVALMVLASRRAGLIEACVAGLLWPFLVITISVVAIQQEKEGE